MEPEKRGFAQKFRDFLFKGAGFDLDESTIVRTGSLQCVSGVMHYT